MRCTKERHDTVFACEAKSTEWGGYMRLAMLIELWECHTPLCPLSYVAGNWVLFKGDA